MIFKKLKSKRGISFAEVLCVVAIMTIMLGIAIPNLLSQSQEIELATMDGYARSVAVAVQSRLYGMKNAGTSIGSEYWMLNETAATDIETTTEEGEPKTVKYVSNFAQGTDEKAQKKAEMAKRLLFSGAITDPEILKNGKIIVFYDPETADVIEVYYSVKEFSVNDVFPTVSETYLKNNNIGLYRGESSPAPERNVGLPNFSVAWKYDDEMYLELAMLGEPDPSLFDKKLGLEVFAVIPDSSAKESAKESEEESKKKVEVLIYAEGIFNDGYGRIDKKDNEGNTTPDWKIKADYDSALTVEKIQKSNNILRFAFDSLITDKADYGNVAPYLRHQTNPSAITAADKLLYPRETIANWFNGSINPYLDFGKSEELGDTSAYDSIKGKQITEIIGVDETVRLRVELHVLSDKTSAAKGEPTASIYNFDDENFVPRKLTSQNVSPYFFALSQQNNTVALSSMRDLNNLSYLFKSKNDITKATLSADIDGQQLQNKLINVRHALIDKRPDIKNLWNYAVNWSSGYIDASFFRNKDSFTLSGTKSDGGSYKINLLRFGQDPQPGGLFTYAKNCTFENLDIVNPLIWKNGTVRDFLLQDDKSDSTDITGLNMNWNPASSGALVGIAVNCTFKNVRTYLDVSQALKVEDKDDPKADRGTQSISAYRITGTIVGGLVGIAIGDDENPTTFENCAASALVVPETYWSPGECVYAGGMVGLAMGNVEIKNSYAASEISGYYAGGLVGGTGSGEWKYGGFPIFGNQSDIVNESGKAEGNLSIKDSFAAGQIMYNVRVGGGLIGHIGKNDKPNVSGCYSAVQWKILPPVTYGTFKGDKGDSNYYIYQKKFDFPVTANVLARFECEGDVLSLSNNGNKGGTPCTEKMLEDKLKDATKWGEAKSTHPWSWESMGNSQPTPGNYPFPMPAGNTDFYGVWNDSYDKDSESVPTFEQKKFDGYCVVYYELHLDYGEGRHIDVGAIHNNARKIVLENNKVYVNATDGEGAGKHELKDNGTFDDSNNGATEGKKGAYWARDVLRPDGSIYGQGVDGATKITAAKDEGKIDFYSAAYYDPNYNVVKGSDFKPELPDAPKFYGNIPLLWDYCGYYFTDYGNNEQHPSKYYITFDKDGETVEEGKAVLGKEYDRFKTIVVNKEEFHKKLKYTNITLSAENVEIQWDNQNGCFCVGDKKA